jgi:hypothetical protein
MTTIASIFSSFLFISVFVVLLLFIGFISIFHFFFIFAFDPCDVASIGVRRGVPKGVEDGCRPLAPWAGHP